jgi:hypothetical protein
VLCRGVLHDAQPLLGRPATHGELQLADRGVGVREEPVAEPVVGPGARHDPRAVDRRGGGEVVGDDPVELVVGGQARLDQALFEPAHPRSDRQARVLDAHLASSR